MDCTDLHRAEGTFSAKRYRITIPNRTDYYPVKINVASTTDFVVKLVGGASSADIGTENGTLSAPRWYAATMVQAPGVSHTTYTVEISAENTNTTGTFSVTMEWFDLEPPTNLKANGDSRSVTNGGQAVVEWTDAPIDTGYSIRYQEYCDVGSCSTWTVQTVPEGANSYTITNLTLSQLYTIQMDTIVGAHIPDWTDPDSVYVYPTPPIPAYPGHVGPVPLWSNPNYRDYNYIICVDTLPEDNPFTSADERFISYKRYKPGHRSMEDRHSGSSDRYQGYR